MSQLLPWRVMQLKLNGVDLPTFHPLILWSIYQKLSKCLATWLLVRLVDLYRDESCNLSRVDSPTFHALTLWSIYRNISKCLVTWLSVRRVDYYHDESCNSSQVESNRQHFIPSPYEAYIEIFPSVLQPDFRPVRRVDYYCDESCNSSRVESTHRHFMTSPSEAYIEIFLSILWPDFRWDESRDHLDDLSHFVCTGQFWVYMHSNSFPFANRGQSIE